MAQETTLFANIVEKYFSPIVKKIIEKINGKTTEEVYFYNQMLTTEYSPSLNWGSAEINTSIVSADVVAMDSPLPLKKRDTYSKASGRIPKLGMSLSLKESDIKTLQAMQRNTSIPESEIASKLLNDVPRTIKGIEMRKEYLFQQALSTGVMLVEDNTNQGTGIRVDFGYDDDNKLTSEIPWSTPATAVPIDDINRVLDKVSEDGASISTIMMSKKYFDYMRNTKQAQTLYANSINLNVNSTGSNLFRPQKQAFIDAIEGEFGIKLIVVDTSLKIEKNGVRTSVKPWEQANVLFLYDNVVGRVVWSDAVEASNPVAGVMYEAGTQGTLISKYSETNPYREFTDGQAFALPVIDSPSDIYMLTADKTTSI